MGHPSGHEGNVDGDLQSVLRDAPALAPWQYRAVIVSILLTALIYLAAVAWSGWQDVASALASVGVGGVLAALSLSLLNYGLRFLRWQAYLHALAQPVPWGQSLRIYLAGFALTTTPAKAGETLRSVMLARLGMTYSRSLAAFFSERLSDLLAVLLLTLTGLSGYMQGLPPALAAAAVIGCAWLVMGQQRSLRALCKKVAQGGRMARALRFFLHVLEEARRCHSIGVFVLALGLGILGWGAEAVAFSLILESMGHRFGLEFAVFVFCLSTLAGALSFLPGGLGTTEAAMAGLLIWKGVPAPDAIAATVLIRLTTLWFAVALGAVSATLSLGNKAAVVN